jgi:hypothetical protein
MAEQSPKAATEKGSDGYQCPPLLNHFQERIKQTRKKRDSRREEIVLNRKYSKGQVHEDGKKGLVRTNLIYANQSTIVPNIYAKNPEIAVTPSRAVSPARYKVVKEFAATLDIVLSRMFVDDTRLKQRVRSVLYSVYNAGDGWLKMFYQRDYETDPLMVSRINDAQDNLARIDELLRATEDPRASGEQKRKQEELKVMIAALQSQAEVVVSEGLVIDRVLSEDIEIIDDTITDFDSYVQSEAIDHMVWMTKDAYAERFGGWPEHGAPTLFHTRDIDKQASVNTNDGKESPQLVCVHEVWWHKSGTILTFGEGAKAYAREPYSPPRMPERWYAFYRLGWNFLDGEPHALPDVTLQRELNDEYNASRTQFAEHRIDSMPVRLARANGNLDDEDLNNIKNRKSRDIVLIKGKPGTPIQDDIGQLNGVPLDPNIYDTSAIRADMEMMAGRGDAAAGGVVEAKTATEAEIQQAGLMGRSDYRRDLTEDLIKEMANAGAQILLQELTVPQVEYLAGEGAVWPKMAKWEVFSLVNIDIRAGSTSKPNKAQEQERWEKLYPIIMQAVQQIFELQAGGNLILASALRALLKETLRKYDERFDLEELLGPEDQSGEAEANQMQTLQQRLQECEMQLQQAQEQLRQVDQSKVQSEQMQLENQSRDQALKEREMEARQQESAAKAEESRRATETKQMELQSGEATQQALEEQRREFEHRAAMEELARTAEDLKKMVTDKLTAAEADDGKKEGAEEDAHAPVKQIASALLEQLNNFQQQVADRESQRQSRAEMIANYMKGPRTPEALSAAIQQLTGSAH